MPRISLLPLREKTKGLWISGPREKTNPAYLRRNRGIHLLRETELRSRNGTTADAAIAGAHSLFRFNDIRYQGDSTILYKAAVSIDTGYDGTPLEFAASEPRTGTDAEYLFVSGGGMLTKVDTSGTVTQWGIDPPSSGDWGTSVGDGSSEESEDATTVFDPQEKTLAASTTGANWSAAGDIDFILVRTGYISPSGSMVCTNVIQSESESDES